MRIQRYNFFLKFPNFLSSFFFNHANTSAQANRLTGSYKTSPDRAYTNFITCARMCEFLKQGGNL